jgi:6-phosphogluconate dehydrogenase
MIGLGKMGANMVRRLARAGISAAVFDRSAEVRRALATETGCSDCDSLESLIQATATPRVVWLMLPAGAPTESTITALLPLLTTGDIIVDGANAWYRDTLQRSSVIRARGVEFVDAGVSGGVWGLENGYGLMLGGTPESIATIRPYLEALAPAHDRGWLHCGPIGAGHFVKMVHNGIEYGMMQAYAEGFALLDAKQELQLDVGAIAESWRHGTVIRSWLLDLSAQFLQQDSALEGIAPVVADSGEGRWTVLESVELGVPTPVMSMALMERFSSQGHGDYSNRVLARMRQAFGGHAVAESGKS